MVLDIDLQMSPIIIFAVGRDRRVFQKERKKDGWDTSAEREGERLNGREVTTFLGVIGGKILNWFFYYFLKYQFTGNGLFL